MKYAINNVKILNVHQDMEVETGKQILLKMKKLWLLNINVI